MIVFVEHVMLVVLVMAMVFLGIRPLKLALQYVEMVLSDKPNNAMMAIQILMMAVHHLV